MYALINRFSENILYVTIMVGNDGCTQYHIDEDGDIPLIHPIPKHFHNIIEGNFLSMSIASIIHTLARRIFKMLKYVGCICLTKNLQTKKIHDTVYS